MYRGSTPTHTFKVPIDTSSIKTIKITYSQKDKELFAKRNEDCTLEEGKIITSLSQEETFMFENDKLVSIQIRVLMDDEKCLPSKIMMVSVDKCLDDEVLK
jgi:hypothetical protein